MAINEKHLIELRASGLADDTINASGIYSADGPAIGNILGWRARGVHWGDGMVIPYMFPGESEPNYSRVKLDFPRHGDNGPIKYESPLKSPNRAYFPPGTFDAIPTATTIIITEGEKKALAVSQHGVPCIGLVGVWGFQEKRLRDENGKAFGERRLVGDLRSIDWNDRSVVIMFDSDVATKNQVQLAEAMLAKTLTDAGATVRSARIPVAKDDAKIGIDDYLVSMNGEATAALQRLIAESVEPAMPEKLSPMDWARLFVDEHFRDERGILLRWYQDEFYRWDDRRYVKLEESELKAIVLSWLDGRIKNAQPKHAADVVKGLESVCRVSFNSEMPLFLSGGNGLNASNIIAFDNGLLDITNIGGDLKLYGHTPEWFSTTVLPFMFFPDAQCPCWCAFLVEVLGDDDAIDLLQMWFGLLLIDDTSYHKILVLIGPQRAGKGTIVRVMLHVIGHSNCTSAALSSLGGDFGLWPLVGKTVAVFPDAHLGRRSDSSRVGELLKSISGEDRQVVNRKNLPQLPHERLRTRIVITLNEFPRLTDASGALASRFLILPFTKSFEGREDRKLEGRLLAEAPGILNWALIGLHKLRQAGRFVVPKQSADLADGFRRLSSPIGAYLEDRCEVAPGLSIFCNYLYDDWCQWCKENGHEPGSSGSFGIKLKASQPAVYRERLATGERQYVYVGVALRRVNRPDST